MSSSIDEEGIQRARQTVEIREGRAAAEAGQERSSNPYGQDDRVSTSRHMLWNHGYDQQSLFNQMKAINDANEIFPTW